MNCGIADITPSVPVETLRTETGTKTTKVTSQLEANVILLALDDTQKLALIGIDALFSSSDLEAEIKNNIPAHIQIVTIATHTHNAPILGNDFAKSSGKASSHISQTSEAISNLINNLDTQRRSTVAISHKKGRCEASVYRRKKTLALNPKRPPFISFPYAMVANEREEISKDINLFDLQNEQGQTIAVVWSWACHATASNDRSSIDADFPGQARKSLRHTIGRDIPVLYLPGFCGDIRPNSASYFTFTKSRFLNPFAKHFSDKSLAKFKAFGEHVANCLRATYEMSEQSQLAETPLFKETSVLLSTIFDGDAPDTFSVKRLNMGVMDIVFVEAEICNGYEAILRNFAQENTVFTGLSGQAYGYLPTDKQIAEGGYEAERFISKFPLEGAYKSSIEDTVASAIKPLFSL